MTKVRWNIKITKPIDFKKLAMISGANITIYPDGSHLIRFPDKPQKETHKKY